MSGIGRYIEILRLFDEARHDWTVQAMSDALGIPTSTAYRTVRDLMGAGMLEPATEGHYRLGAAFIEFDRLIRLTDPLVNIGTTILRDVTGHARLPCVAVLARLYGDTVMCIADVSSSGETVRTSYERGRPRPLTRGATSKMILAQLPTRRLKKLLAADDRSDQRFPLSEDAFRQELTAIRKRGYCVTRGEVDPGRAGIAVPIAVPERALLASLSLVVDSSSLDASAERRLVLLLVSSASLITEHLRTGRSADDSLLAAARAAS